MKILLFSSSYAPRAGGVETVTRRLASELRERGHAVLVMTNRYPRTLAAREEIDGVRVVRRLYPDVLWPRERPASLLALLKKILMLPVAPVVLVRLYLEMRRFRPDIVNVHYFSYPAVYALLAAKLCGIPVTLSCHGSDVPTVPYPASRLRPFLWACRLSSTFTACSQDIRSYLAPLLAGQSRGGVWIAYCGIEPQQTSRDDSQPRERTVLVAARLVENKAVDVAIRAAAVLRDRGKAISLVIAGDGPLRSDLQALTLQLNIAEHVTFTGQVTHAEVNALMVKAGVVLIPSRWEAFGIVCLEAMAGERPVVATRAGGLAEIIVHEESGLLFESGDVRDCADNLDRMLSTPHLAGLCAQGGRERAAAMFTYDSMVASYLEAFQASVAAARVTGHEPAAI